MPTGNQKIYDFIVLGATSMVAKELIPLMAEKKLNFTIAGRNLEKIKNRFKDNQDLHSNILHCDLNDEVSIDAITEKCRILLNLVGPFHVHGDKVVKSCLKHNTHYLDITGECFYAKRLIESFQDQAEKKKLMIMPFSGFDSIPTELGSLLVAKKFARENAGQLPNEINHYVRLKGGLNGGSLASAIDIYSFMSPDENKNVFYFRDNSNNLEWQLGKSPYFCQHKKTWASSFFMEGINSKVLFWSFSRKENYRKLFAQNFIFRELSPSKNQFTANLESGVGALFERVMGNNMGKKIISFIGPKQGEGPNKVLRDSGFFKSIFTAKNGKSFTKISITSQGDPGNKSTAKILLGAALCTLSYISQPTEEITGGVGTPVYFFGEKLLSNLEDMDIKFEI